ncbi:unnamed protein product [Ixodes persulcatus]
MNIGRANMWHEARKQERKIRGMLVDLKKRAERRKEFYERIKQDPAQFLQLHGRRCKIHIDLAIAQAADSPATMMPWQGHPDIMIDRFDVRAHLDTIPEYKSPVEPLPLSNDQREEERQINYERYRTLVQNDFLGVSEDKFLHQIFLEERYGPVGRPVGTTEEEKKKLAEKKAAIGYVYEDSTPVPSTSAAGQNEDEEEEDKEDLSDIDLDITIDVNELNDDQAREMNANSVLYGMEDTDFISFLHLDKEEQERLKQARELEEEKAMYSGRKSRRERRALREKKLKNRVVTSPPSYAARESPTYKPFRAQSSSRSRSRSPQNAGEITFITSFGGEGSDDEDAAGTKKAATKPAATAASTTKASSNNAPKAASTSKGAGRQDNSSLSKSKPRERSRSRGRYNSSSRSSNHGRGARPSRWGSSSSRSRSRSRSSSRGRRDKRRRRSRSWERSYRTQRRGTRPSPRSRSRSRQRNSRWRSPSRSRSRSRSRRRGSRRRSSSSPPKSRRSPSPPKKLPSPPRKSYYRHSLSRSRSKSPSSEAERKSGTSEDDNSESSRGQAGAGGANGVRRTWPAADALKTNVSVGKPGPASKGGAPSGLTPREKLKRKMQAALNKQYKADKRAEREKQDKILQERWDRAEELRGMAMRMRQRDRRGRDKDDYDYDPEDGREGYSSRSASRSPSRSRSRSAEPRPPGESPPSYPGASSRNPSHYPRRRSRSRSRSPPPDYYRSRPAQSSSSSSWSSRNIVDY